MCPHKRDLQVLIFITLLSRPSLHHSNFKSVCSSLFYQVLLLITLSHQVLLFFTLSSRPSFHNSLITSFSSSLSLMKFFLSSISLTNYPLTSNQLSNLPRWRSGFKTATASEKVDFLFSHFGPSHGRDLSLGQELIRKFWKS